MTDAMEVDAFLAHYGVKGMRWGVRHDGPAGVSSRTNREAKKDAAEFTKAKLFYGEGAGTRRKLIKATVEAKSKRDPSYKKAFDHHVNQTDLSKRASQARGERKRKDIKKGTGKAIRGTRHVLNGNSQFASATVAIAAGGALYAHRAGIDKMILDHGKTSMNQVRKAAQNRRNRQIVENLLKGTKFG